MGFRLPGMFGYACYDQPPSTQGAQFIGCGTFKMDTAGLAQCYRTADGVGVGGPTMKADVGRRRGGVSWKWAFVPVLAMMVLAYFAPGWISGLVRSAVMRGSGKEVTTEVLNVIAASNAVSRTLIPVTNEIVVRVQEKIEQPRERKHEDYWTNSPTITGALWVPPDGWFVQLSDGRRFIPGDLYRVRGDRGSLVGVKVEPGSPWIGWKH